MAHGRAACWRIDRGVRKSRFVGLSQRDRPTMSAAPLNVVTIGAWPKADALSGSLGNGNRRSVPPGQTFEVGCVAAPLNLVTIGG